MSDVYFYKYLVNRQVFFRSKYCYALVNLKPIVEGHVLLVPYNTNIIRFNQLNDEESIDYMKSLQIITRFLTWNYRCDSLNIAIQDGPESGQSVPHLHTHLIPRYKQDDFQNDKIHETLENIDLIKDFESRRLRFLDTNNRFVVKDEDRSVRSDEQMELEANRLKNQLEQFNQIDINT